MVPQISIVILVYNEEENINILYEEIRKSMNQIKTPYEIIFIDDGSSDNTFECLKNIKIKEGREDEALACTQAIRFSCNFLQTAEMQTVDSP